MSLVGWHLAFGRLGQVDNSPVCERRIKEVVGGMGSGLVER